MTAAAVSSNHLDARIVSGKPLLTCYFPLGDPLFDDAMLALYARCGVDILELGVPTHDPFLDGAEVANAMRNALAAGSDIGARLSEVAGWLHADPARPAGICMAYPDLDYDRVLGAGNLAAIDGLLIPGLDQRDDADAIREQARAADTRLIAFVSTDLNADEVAVAREVDGYIMLQARPGVTGPSNGIDAEGAARIARLRETGVTRPILLGFGISTGPQAAQSLAMGADGVIIGSMCIKKAREGATAIEDFLGGVRAAMDG